MTKSDPYPEEFKIEAVKQIAERAPGERRGAGRPPVLQAMRGALSHRRKRA